MNFTEATDRLTQARATLADIAEACGVSENLVQRARMDGEGRRSPPPGWREAVARLARERGVELEELADDLEGEE